MPLTEKGEKIERAMKKQYGPEKGEQVFYASKNKGTIKGVDADTPTMRHQPYNRKAFLVKMRDALRSGLGLQAAMRDAVTADHAMAFRDAFADAISRGVPVRDAIAGARTSTKRYSRITK